MLQVYTKRLEVILNCGRVAVACIEPVCASRLSRDFLDNMDPIPFSVCSFDANIRDETLEAHTFCIGHFSQVLWIPLSEELQAETDEVYWFIHDPCGDVDVDVHPILGGTQGLEIALPQFEASHDILLSHRCEERPCIKGVPEIRLHSNHDIQSLHD